MEQREKELKARSASTFANMDLIYLKPEAIDSKGPSLIVFALNLKYKVHPGATIII